MRTVVIGAGLAGLTCASRLQDAGHEVLVLDKGRGAGGRASTRRGDGVRFDHGARCVSPRGAAFAELCAAWVEAGAAARWPGEVVRLVDGVAHPLESTPAFVGVPGMSALIKHAGRALDVRYRARATALSREGEAWWVQLEDGERLGPFARAVVAVPAEQAAPLLAAAPRLAERVAKVEMEPCWTLLARFEHPRELSWVRALPGEGGVVAISREHTKPGRSPQPAWVAQATPEWTQAHLERSPAEACDLLLEATAAAVGGLPPLREASAHRWRYARAVRPLGEPCLLDLAAGLGVCGDWCLGQELEDAYLSGAALGDALGA